MEGSGSGWIISWKSSERWVQRKDHWIREQIIIISKMRMYNKILKSMKRSWSMRSQIFNSYWHSKECASLLGKSTKQSNLS